MKALVKKPSTNGIKPVLNSNINNKQSNIVKKPSLNGNEGNIIKRTSVAKNMKKWVDRYS